MIRKSLLALIAAILVAGTVAAQSLADAAREAKKNKRTTSNSNRVYTNDSLGIGSTPARLNPTLTDAPTAKSTEDASAQSAAKDSTEDEKKKASEEAKTKIAKAKAEVAQLQRELDVLQRENRLRAAQFYADAGERLRNESKYAEEDRKYQSDIAAKQKAVAAAQAQVESLTEEARRAGVPAGQLQ